MYASDGLEKYRDVTFAIDVMATNKLPFIITTFGTAELICYMMSTTMTSIQQFIRAYHARGFQLHIY